MVLANNMDVKGIINFAKKSLSILLNFHFSANLKFSYFQLYHECLAHLKQMKTFFLVKKSGISR